MEQQQQTREFILRYFNEISGVEKTRGELGRFISDESLIGHILEFESAFPGYKVLPDEMIVENDRVVVKARLSGTHKGELNGIPPTYRQVDVPFAICYVISNNKITNHWMVVDRMTVMEQLGVMETMEK